MSTWQIVKSGAISPPSGGAFDAAYFVRLVFGSSTRVVVVEFVAPSAVASFAYAEEVTRPFLDQEEPPMHLVVEPGGAVSVHKGAVQNLMGEPLNCARSPTASDPTRAHR